jgi:peptide/nickel transport system substrate-binding protein
MESGFHPAVSSKRKTKTLTFLSTLLIITALLLSACGGANNNNTSSTRILRVASHIGADFTENFSPLEPTTGGADGTRGMIYETLYYFNSFNGSESPVLAQSYTWNADNTEVTFNLRQNVQWSDGQPFTADDVVFTFNLIKQYPGSDTNGVWNYLSSVEKKDNNTVVAKLKQSYPPAIWFIAGQTFIVPKHIFETQGDPGKFANTKPVGTGPFTLKTFAPSLVVYQKNPKFWAADQVQIDELQYPAIKDNNVVQEKLLKGQVDWGGFFAPDLDTTYVAKDPANNHYWMSPVAFTMIYLNLSKAPFNDVAVRHAISAAVDRDQIAKQAVSGYVTAASPTGLTPGQLDKAAPEYKDLKFSLDVAKAQQYLDNAGYKKGADGIYLDKSGKPMAYNILVPAGWTDWEQACQIISQSVSKIGIKITATSIDQNAYFSARNTGDYDMLMGSVPTPGPKPFYTYDSVLNGAKTADIGKATTTNWERWKDAKTDDLLKTLGTTTDPAVEKEAILGLQKVMVEQQPVILLLNHPAWYVYSTKNFTGFPSKDDPYALGATYSVPDNEQVIMHLRPKA